MRGSGLEEKPWQLEGLCQCGNLLGEGSAVGLYASQNKPVGEGMVLSSLFRSESQNSVVSSMIASDYL